MVDVQRCPVVGDSMLDGDRRGHSVCAPDTAG
jgi:hypothetical protein